MNIDFIKRLLLFVVLLLVQVIVLNHIHLFGVATPFLYIYFVISFQRGYPKWAILAWSFLLGLGIDTFANTPGVATASLTLAALLQPYVMELFIQRDNEENLQPSISTLGPSKYITFALILTLVYCLTFFSLETFTFFNWLQWLLNFSTSTVLTLLLVIVIDGLRRS